MGVSLFNHKMNLLKGVGGGLDHSLWALHLFLTVHKLVCIRFFRVVSFDHMSNFST
ncbi:hypothetical protein HanPSC8_Chr13g0558791 [Helianthus annuus]|nr:hypothetical protein HanPSC8_Chr13g0558791 [Helianthus annuus]